MLHKCFFCGIKKGNVMRRILIRIDEKTGTRSTELKWVCSSCRNKIPDEQEK